MTTCDNDHELIGFASPFRALCPLCAMRRKMEEAEEAALSSAADTIATELLAALEMAEGYIAGVATNEPEEQDKLMAVIHSAIAKAKGK